MIVVAINPGSGPVGGTTEKLARLAMRQPAKDTGSEKFKRDKRHDQGDGRYAFKIYHRDRRGRLHAIDVEMPGLPLDQVRYLGPPQNIWDFPRLYVDGSSWVWLYAVDAVKRHDEE